MPAHDPGEFAEKLFGALAFLGTCVKVLKVVARKVAEAVEESKDQKAAALPKDAEGEEDDCEGLRRRLADALADAEDLRGSNARLRTALERADVRADKADARAAQLQEWVDARAKGQPPTD